MRVRNWLILLRKTLVQPPVRPVHRRIPRGQSLVELALFFPVLLILFSGVVEFGILLNQYLNVLDGPREAARFAVDYTPFGSMITTDNAAFYSGVACEAVKSIQPITLNASIDDVVISVFGISNTANPPIITRYPNAGHINGNGGLANCSAVESALDTTVGEWHLLGHGNCDPADDVTCHPSRFTANQVAARVAQTGGAALPNNMGAILVEVFYGYPQTLKLPWLAFISDPIPVYTYTIMPLPAAEPR
jgi:hypothetical protein